MAMARGSCLNSSEPTIIGIGPININTKRHLQQLKKPCKMLDFDAVTFADAFTSNVKK